MVGEEATAHQQVAVDVVVVDVECLSMEKVVEEEKKEDATAHRQFRLAVFHR